MYRVLECEEYKSVASCVLGFLQIDVEYKDYRYDEWGRLMGEKDQLEGIVRKNLQIAEKCTCRDVEICKFIYNIYIYICLILSKKNRDDR